MAREDEARRLNRRLLLYAHREEGGTLKEAVRAGAQEASCASRRASRRAATWGKGSSGRYANSILPSDSHSE